MQREKEDGGIVKTNLEIQIALKQVLRVTFAYSTALVVDSFPFPLPFAPELELLLGPTS